MLARKSVVSMSNDAILILFLFFFVLAGTLSVYTTRAFLRFILRDQFYQSNQLLVFHLPLPPLIYNLVGHTVNISSSYLLHLGTVTHGIDRMIDT